MKIGDKIICENKHIYTLGDGNGFYTFSIIDEFGKEVCLVHDYYLNECLPIYKEEQKLLCIGRDRFGKIKYTKILELIEI